MNPIPRSLFGRAVIVLILGLTATHLVSMAVHYGNANHRLALLGGDLLIGRIVTTVTFLRRMPVDRRREAITQVKTSDLSLALAGIDSVEGARTHNWRSNLLGTRLADFFPEARVQTAVVQSVVCEGTPGANGSSVSNSECTAPFDRLLIEISLPDTGDLLFATPTTTLGADTIRSIILEIIVMWAGILVLSIWAARWLIRPLKAFGRVAEMLGKDIRTSLDEPAGPHEIRLVARAMNQMQARLRRFIEDRTSMLAAISHDLRTPITRLRLRAEFVEDTAQRDKMLSDLEEMERMTESTLIFARDEVTAEKPQMVDIAAVLQSICSDMLDTGHAVSLDDCPPTPINGRPISLKRGFSNLIMNAVAYGQNVWVHIRGQQASIIVEIEDDGPGVPDSELENVFAPFYRVDKSRNCEIAGTGLGLAVARSIFRGHGGEVLLENRDAGGLRATVTIPK